MDVFNSFKVAEYICEVAYAQGYIELKVARRPWAPKTFLDFAIKTGYVLDPWKTFCCSWVFFAVLESYWTVVKLFIIELLIILNIQELRLNNIR